MGTYRMVGNKTPGSSANQTGANLPPSLIGWVDELDDINWSQIGRNLETESEQRREKREELKTLPFKGQKKKRFWKNRPKNAKENAEFIKAGGGSRPSF